MKPRLQACDLLKVPLFCYNESIIIETEYYVLGFTCRLLSFFNREMINFLLSVILEQTNIL